MAHDTKSCPKIKNTNSYASKTANIPDNLDNNPFHFETQDNSNLINIDRYSFSSVEGENSLEINAFNNAPNLHKELKDAGAKSFEASLREKPRTQSSPKSIDEGEEPFVDEIINDTISEISQHIHSNQEAQKKNNANSFSKTIKNFLSFSKSGNNESSSQNVQINKRKNISATEDENTPREKRQNYNNSLANTQNEWQRDFESQKSVTHDYPTSNSYLVQRHSFYKDSSREGTQASKNTNI